MVAAGLWGWGPGVHRAPAVGSTDGVQAADGGGKGEPGCGICPGPAPRGRGFLAWGPRPPPTTETKQSPGRQHGAASESSPASLRVPPPQAFNVVFEKAIQKTTPAEEVRQRVINLTDEITYSVYMYTARGLFERDKLIFLAQVAFQVRLPSRQQRRPRAGPQCRLPGDGRPSSHCHGMCLGLSFVDMRHSFKEEALKGRSVKENFTKEGHSNYIYGLPAKQSHVGGQPPWMPNTFLKVIQVQRNKYASCSYGPAGIFQIFVPLN